MDIFTILVFFLLVNSSDVEVLPSAKTIQLPESAAEQKPRETVIVMITEKDILVQGHKVLSLEEALAGPTTIKLLQTKLEQLAARRLRSRAEGEPGPEVTIMGDKEIPYRILKKVMVTATVAKYGKVSLAVLRKSAEEI